MNSTDSKTPDAASRSKGTAAEAESYNKNFEDTTPPSHEDSAIESLGKAITAPMRDAADEGSTEEADRKRG